MILIAHLVDLCPCCQYDDIYIYIYIYIYVFIEVISDLSLVHFRHNKGEIINIGIKYSRGIIVVDIKVYNTYTIKITNGDNHRECIKKRYA